MLMRLGYHVIVWSLAVALLPGVLAAPENTQSRSSSPDALPAAVRTVPLDASAGSGQPRLAVTPAGVLLVSWLEPVGETGWTRLRVATRSADQREWSTPRTVAEGTGWFVNFADVPAVVPISDTLWAAHWLERTDPASPYAYDVRLVISSDAGQSWSPPITPHTDGTPTEHGFVSLFAWPGVSTPVVGLAWLDGRRMKPGGEHGGDQGAMTLRAARVDPDGTLRESQELDARVCECCPTTAVSTSDGVLVAYRNRDEDETRDIHIVRHDGAWQTGRAAAVDGWKINACPVNGPALSASGSSLALAWFTAVNDTPRVKVSFSDDGGRTWGQGHVVDAGMPLGRVAVASLADGGAVVSWIEAEREGASIRLRRVGTRGATAPSVVAARVAQSRLSGYPRLVRSGQHLEIAWVEGERGATRVQTASLPLSDVP